MAKSYKAKLAAKQAIDAKLDSYNIFTNKSMPDNDFEQELNKEMRPWNRRADTKTEDKGLWIGQDVRGFNNRAQELEKDILDIRGSNTRFNTVLDHMVNDFGYGDKEALNEINKVNNGGHLAAITHGVPNAQADERLSTLLLDASGVPGARMWSRGDPHWSTDIMANIGPDGHAGIDAQRRMAGDGILKLNVFHQESPQNIAKAMKIFKNYPEMKLKQALGILGDLKEGKYMHTQINNPNMSNYLSDNFDDLRKDYLITSDMAGYKQNKDDFEVFGNDAHGSYNPVAPKGISVLDLNRMREEAGDMKLQELRSLGVRARGDGNALYFDMTPEALQRFGNESMLDDRLVREVTRRSNWNRELKTPSVRRERG